MLTVGGIGPVPNGGDNDFGDLPASLEPAPGRLHVGEASPFVHEREITLRSRGDHERLLDRSRIGLDARLLQSGAEQRRHAGDMGSRKLVPCFTSPPAS